MAQPQPPEPVKLFVAILWSDEALRLRAEERLCAAWGPLDFQGPDRPFDVTDYYASEMGERLLRRLVAFGQLVTPDILAEAKLHCNAIEDELATPNGRTINLDVGYLDHNKILLASAKAAGQKVYVGRGIYADLAGRYARGRYQPFDWSFPDFRDGRYDPDLALMRKTYLEQLRQLKGQGCPAAPG